MQLYAQNMDKICHCIDFNMQNMHNLCTKYARHWQKICRKYAQIYLKDASNMHQICIKCAIT